ncbi:hypothetical protein SODG_005896 [Sodalis praecaptivus]
MLLSEAETNNGRADMARHAPCLPGSETRCMWRSSSYGTWEILNQIRDSGPWCQSVKTRYCGVQEVGHGHSTGEISEQNM